MASAATVIKVHWVAISIIKPNLQGLISQQFQLHKAEIWHSSYQQRHSLCLSVYQKHNLNPLSCCWIRDLKSTACIFLFICLGLACSEHQIFLWGKQAQACFSEGIRNASCPTNLELIPIAPCLFMQSPGNRMSCLLSFDTSRPKLSNLLIQGAQPSWPDCTKSLKQARPIRRIVQLCKESSGGKLGEKVPLCVSYCHTGCAWARLKAGSQSKRQCQRQQPLSTPFSSHQGNLAHLSMQHLLSPAAHHTAQPWHERHMELCQRQMPTLETPELVQPDGTSPR